MTRVKSSKELDAMLARGGAKVARPPRRQAMGRSKVFGTGGDGASMGVKPETLALGRLKAGEMNGTEAAYAALLQLRQRAGEVLWFAFEAIKFRLAPDTHYTPDFAVMLADGVMEFHEVKGHWMDDAKVKFKVAAETFPFRFIAMRRAPKGQGGGFVEQAL